MAKKIYRSDVVTGKKYRDDQTGIEGMCTSLIFFQHGCERACIEYVVAGDIKEGYFDAERLSAVEPERKVRASRRGGGNNPPSRSSNA